jgi:circadian clock protein KaiC
VSSLSPRARTGIAGLDDVLGGGFPRNRIYLLEGDPGAGKTTLALQFLLEGVRAGEAGLYVTLSETREEVRAVADSHGWSLDGLEMCELTTPAQTLRSDTQYTLFHPSEVELADMTRTITNELDRVRALRVVFDSLSEMRLLARDSLRFRRQMLAFKQFFSERSCTVMLLDDRTPSDARVDTVVNGIVTLDQLAPVYGSERRRLRVLKLRGVRYRGGYHDFAIHTGGLVVFPRLVAAETREATPLTPLPSGVAELDALTGGGVEHGTNTMILGPAGTGKSVIAARYGIAAAARGEGTAFYLFDESVATFLHRSAGLGMDLRRFVDAGTIRIRQVDPAELSPGEFAHEVRDAVIRDGVRVVVIDSLNGYMSAMPNEPYLSARLHELMMFLGQHGVASVIIAAQTGLVGADIHNPLDVSYLADTVLLTRHFEAAGEVRQALSVVKRRTGPHERTLRELRLVDGTLALGPALVEFEGVLTGVPRHVRNGGE